MAQVTNERTIKNPIVKLASKLLIALTNPNENGSCIDNVKRASLTYPVIYRGVRYGITLTNVEAEQKRISELLANVPDDD